jgi:hypothetical protein
MEGFAEIHDRRIILALMSRRHAPKKVEVRDRVVYFLYDPTEIEADLSAYLSGEPFNIDLHQFFRAEDIFKSYLNNRRLPS